MRVGVPVHDIEPGRAAVRARGETQAAPGVGGKDGARPEEERLKAGLTGERLQLHATGWSRPIDQQQVRAGPARYERDRPVARREAADRQPDVVDRGAEPGFAGEDLDAHPLAGEAAIDHEEIRSTA